MTISGTIDDAHKDEDSARLLRHERRSGQFSRTITLPAPVQSDQIDSRVENGLMTVTIPKA